MDSTCTELAVVSIDFGTTFSGYAYSFTAEYKKDPKKISCNTKWSTGTNTYGSLKTPTAVLLKWDDDEGDFEAIQFGYDAQNKYTELVDEDEHEDYILVDRFKMELYSESARSGLKRNTEICLTNGQRINAMRLISMFIEYLKDHFLSSVKERVDINVSDIRWVLSVPAIWTDGAKQFMREAAEMAGIPSANLSIAFEPEVAALCCLHLTDPTKDVATSMLKPGSTFLLVDAGGGTVDFTVHEVSASHRSVLKHAASGGPWGGTVVDEKFIEVFKNILGPVVFERFKEDNRDDLVELYRDFELKKRNLRDDQTKVTFRFPVSVGHLYEQMTGRSIKDALSEKYGGKISIIKDKLRIDVDLVKSFFDGPTESVLSHTKQLLRGNECKDVDTIILVGGFGSSEVMRTSIKKKFPRMKVITPEDPELSVVKGAVLYGHNPLVVKSRIARYTYGVVMLEHFQAYKHPESKKCIIGGVEACNDLFSIHKNKGQKIIVGEPGIKKTYFPQSVDDTCIEFSVYASTEESPRFVTDIGCTHIGTLTIAIPDITRGLDRSVSVVMSYGEAELVVTATEEDTKKTVSTNINFLDVLEP